MRSPAATLRAVPRRTVLPTHPAIASIQLGTVAPLGPDAVPSAFVKHTAPGPVRVTRLGLEGDSQADPTVHGGPEKAVYAYAAARYPEWRTELPQHGPILLPGAFGENLTLDGMTEDDLCAGDVHAVGTARLQVCQPRQPCFKLALRFADPRLPRAMVRNRRAGWYYRVVGEGTLAPGDPVRLVDRPNPALPFSVLIDVLYGGTASAADMARIAEASGISSELRTKARRALDAIR